MERTANTLSLQDESYLCLLCLRDSTQRIAHLYLTYIQLRQRYSHEAPMVLYTVLWILCEKRAGLESKLQEHYPHYMSQGKWHDSEEQHEQLRNLSQESREDLHQICSTEMKLLALISEMMKSR